MKKLVFTLLAASTLLACGGSKVSAECKKYIDCAKAISAESGTAAENLYGEASTCYDNSQNTTICNAACTTTLAFTKATNGANVTACQ